jgi:hypothetical protein
VSPDAPRATGGRPSTIRLVVRGIRRSRASRDETGRRQVEAAAAISPKAVVSEARLPEDMRATTRALKRQAHPFHGANLTLAWFPWRTLTPWSGIYEMTSSSRQARAEATGVSSFIDATEESPISAAEQSMATRLCGGGHRLRGLRALAGLLPPPSCPILRHALANSLPLSGGHLAAARALTTGSVRVRGGPIGSICRS